MSVCPFCRILLLIAVPIWFSFTVKLLIGHGKVYNYLRVGTTTRTPPREITPQEYLLYFSFKTKI